MAGRLIEVTGRLKGMKCVEVTGTYGKTTTCTLLGRMLQAAGEHVLVHASTGLSFDGKPVGERLSITPANMLRALDIARDAGLRPTTCVFEVSLGGCGTADVGVITTMDRDYPVAGGTKRSYTAKMQMAEYAKPGSTIVHQASYRLTGRHNEITFGEGGDLYFASKRYDRGPANGRRENRPVLSPLSLISTHMVILPFARRLPPFGWELSARTVSDCAVRVRRHPGQDEARFDPGPGADGQLMFRTVH